MSSHKEEEPGPGEELPRPHHPPQPYAPSSYDQAYGGQNWSQTQGYAYQDGMPQEYAPDVEGSNGEYSPQQQYRQTLSDGSPESQGWNAAPQSGGHGSYYGYPDQYIAPYATPDPYDQGLYTQEWYWPQSYTAPVPTSYDHYSANEGPYEAYPQQQYYDTHHPQEPVDYSQLYGPSNEGMRDEYVKDSPEFTNGFQGEFQSPVQDSSETAATEKSDEQTGPAPSLLKSSAVMAAGTMVSRVTGFIRSALIVAALGSFTLGDTFQVAYQLPTMIYILTIGGGLNSVFVPQLVRSMKEDEDGGEAYANRLLTFISVILAGLAALAVLAAPLLVRLLSVETANNAQADRVAVVFVRYCVPTIFFMGIYVVMGQILNARGRFGAMMWTPVLNNIITITAFGMFIWVYGTASHSGINVYSISPQGERLLGAGVLLGLVVQALAMAPYLREAGFTLRVRFDWKGHGLGKSMTLAKWTVLFVLANQAGAIIVTQLSTAAGARTRAGGTGFIAYANAQLIWGLPQAIITVSLMAALLPRLARAAHDGDTETVRNDISHGLRTSAVAIVPVAFSFLALGIPMCTLVFGSAGTSDATSMGYMLMAFSLGLIPYSVQYVVLRAFYAYEDTRTPFYNTVIVAGINAGASALCFLALPPRWAVTGMAASYGLAYLVGVIVAWRRLRKRLGGELDGANIVRTYTRLVLASVPAAVLAAAACYAITRKLGQGIPGSLCALLAGLVILFGCFIVIAKRLRITEVNIMTNMVRSRLG